MCVVKTPKVSSSAAAEKPPQTFTNEYFMANGPDALRARVGRNALKITRNTGGNSLQIAGPSGLQA